MYIEIIVTVIIGVACIIAFSRFRSKKDETSEQIKLGLTVLTHIQKVISLSQQHRGTSNAFLQGNEQLRRKLELLQHDLDKLISEGTALNLAEFAQWESFTEHWPRLKDRSLNCSLESKNLVRQHNMLIDSQLSLLDDAVSYYGLNTLKLDDITYVSGLCLDVLRVVETIAKARGVGAGVCAKGKCTGIDESSLGFLKTSMYSATNELISQLNAINNSTLSERFASSSQSIKSGIDELIDVISTQVLTGKTETMNASDYFNIATKPIDDLLEIFDVVIVHASKQYKY